MPEMRDGMYVQTYHQDCVIISIANYTGKSYEEIIQAAITCGANDVLEKGTKQILIGPTLGS